jgi:ankyrin repeat protein
MNLKIALGQFKEIFKDYQPDQGLNQRQSAFLYELKKSLIEKEFDLTKFTQQFNNFLLLVSTSLSKEYSDLNDIDFTDLINDVYTNLSFSTLSPDPSSEQKRLFLEFLKNNIVSNILTDVHKKYDYGRTALMLACQFGHLEILKGIISNKLIDLNEKDEFGQTAFMLACDNGHLELVKDLLKIDGIDVNAKDEDGRTALMLARQSGHFEVVQELLKIDAIDDNRFKDFRVYQSNLIDNLNKYFNETESDDIKINEKGICQSITFTYLNHYFYHKDKGASFLDFIQQMSHPANGVQFIRDLYQKPQLLLDEPRNQESDGLQKEKLREAYENLAIIDEFILHYSNRNKDEDKFFLERRKKDQQSMAGLVCYDSASMIFNADIYVDNRTKIEQFFTLGNDFCPFHAGAAYELATATHSMLIIVEDASADKKPVLNFFDPNLGIVTDPCTIANILLSDYKYNPLDLTINSSSLLLEINCFKPKDEKLAFRTVGEELSGSIKEKLQNTYDQYLQGLSEKQKILINRELLFFAVRYDQPHLIKRCLSLNDPVKALSLNILNRHGETALMVACKSGSVEVVKELLKIDGIDIKVKSTYGETALMMACTSGSVEVVKELLKIDGIDITVKNKSHETALMLACKSGSVEVVKELLKIDKSTVNEKSLLDETALMLACMSGSVDIVKELLKIEDIDVNEKNSFDETAFRLACNSGSISCIDLIKEFLNSEKIVRSMDDSDATILDAIIQSFKKHFDHDFMLELLESYDRFLNNRAGKVYVDSSTKKNQHIIKFSELPDESSTFMENSSNFKKSKK